MNDAWATLELEPTTDLALIKQTYARLIKQFRPDTHPEQFKKIRAAYEAILNYLRNPESTTQGQDAQHNHEVPVPTEPDVQADEDHALKQMILDKLMDVYQDENHRNDVKAWRAILNDYDTDLVQDQYFGAVVLRNIIKWQFLYKSDFVMNTDIYILLFDFFDIPEGEFLEDYNPGITNALLQRIIDRREELYLASIELCEFNNYDRFLQHEAERYLHKLLNLQPEELHGQAAELENSVANQEYRRRKIFARVAFKYILDTYLSTTREVNEYMAGVLFFIYRLNSFRKDFLEIFPTLNYSREDVQKCFELCNYCYQTHIRKKEQDTWDYLTIGSVILAVLIFLIKSMK